MADIPLQWLMWARKLQALAQNGLTFTENPFEKERFESIQQIAAEMMAACSQHDTQPILDLFLTGAGYATPKLDVRGAAFQDNKILLVQEKSDGLWTLPGGFADINESPAEAITREVFEESGYLVRTTKLLALYDKLKHPHPPEVFHFYKIFFLCEIMGHQPGTNLETSDAQFFSEDKLPPLSLPRVIASQIHRLFAHYRHPDWPTDFD
ncbi:MAG: NUDIX hydrolase [Gammaproteobacteria bacterium]